MKRLVMLLITSLILAACGTAEPTATPPLTTSNDPTAILVERYSGGGFTMPIFQNLNQLPTFRLYGDGRAIYQFYNTEGQLAWHETQLSAEQAQSLISTVVGNDRALCRAVAVPQPPIADAPTIRIIVNLPDQTCSAEVYALGFEAERPGISTEGAAFLGQAQQADTAIMALQNQPGTPYKPESVRLLVQDIGATPDAQPWPLAAETLRDNTTLTDDDAAQALEFAAVPRVVEQGDHYVQVLALPVLP